MLQQLTERVHAWQGAVNFGIIRLTDRLLAVIDTGLDAGNVRKALRPFLEEGCQVHTIINTHSHADHCGGNAELVKRYGSQVLAPALEIPFILHPELEAHALYGGVQPPPPLDVKFLHAAPTPAAAPLPEGAFELEGVSFSVLPIPGHSLAQVAIAVDDVLFAADGFFRPEQIERHPITFVIRVGQMLESLERLAACKERWVVPGHGEHLDQTRDDLATMLQANRNQALRLQAILLDLLSGGPQTEEQLVFETQKRLGKTLGSEPQYFLDRAAVAAHLSHLCHARQVQIGYEGGRRYLYRI